MTIDSLKQENRDLEDKMSSIGNQNSSLQSQISHRNQKYEKLLEVNNIMKTENSKLNDQLDQLSARVLKLQED